jgi:hypothetical protein
MGWLDDTERATPLVEIAGADFRPHPWSEATDRHRAATRTEPAIREALNLADWRIRHSLLGREEEGVRL